MAAPAILSSGGQRISVNHGFVSDHPHLHDLAGSIRQEVRPHHTDFQVLLDYRDGSQASNHGVGESAITVSVGEEQEALRTGPRGAGTYRIRELTLHISDAPTGKTIDNVTIHHPSNHWPWKIHGSVGVDFSVTITGEAPNLKLIIPLMYPHGTWLSAQLSCHDNGGDGTPLDSNPYAAHGSRFIFGYSVMLTPAVPIFMSGEEFNADYMPLPTHTPGPFGRGEPGTGRWLYASWLQWDQLADRTRAAMLVDVKRMIHIRRAHAELIHPYRVGQTEIPIIAITHSASVPLPMPYLYQGQTKCLLIAGNPHLDQDVEIQFEVTFAQLGMNKGQSFKEVDLWDESVLAISTAEEFARHTFTIKRDKAVQGGLLILSIERV